MSFMGEDRVIVVRDNDGNAQVLVNSCRHRGNAVCRAEEGHSSSFMCTYHGWTYDLKGNLVGVPGFKEVYHEGLDRENWGLIAAGKVDSYKGFIFATMDGEAPDLDEYLGDVGRMGLSLLSEKGDLKAVPGVQKYTIPCNWKLAVDNVWDWYHPQLSHASSNMAGYTFRRPTPGQPGPKLKGIAAGGGMLPDHMVLLGDYGHAISGPRLTEETKKLISNVPGLDETWRESPKAQKELGPVGIRARGHPNIFPSAWMTGNQISLRHPKGPWSTEIWWFTFLDPATEAETYTAMRGRASHTFGPAGMLEQDDGENWEQSTKAMRGVISQRFPVNYQMGLNHGDAIDDESGPPHIETGVNEHAQLWLYRGWAEWMAAESWADLKANHTRAPRDTV
jgi:3-phenylpropionate/trans-cinnamate dioxygenase alpha subunit